MIRSLRLVNYRSYRDCQLTLEPLTVFIGPVGGGKSNVFRALALLKDTVTHEPAELFGPYPYDFWSHRHRGVSTSTDAIGIHATVTEVQGFPQDMTAHYRLELGVLGGETCIVREVLDRGGLGTGGLAETLFDRRQVPADIGEFGYVEPGDLSILGQARRMAGPNSSERVGFAAGVADQLYLQGYHHLEVDDLRQPSYGDDEKARRHRLSYTGKDLPAALACIRDERAGSYDEICHETTELLRGLQELRLTRVGQGGLGLAFQFENQEGYLSSADVSDGTLLTLGLLAIAKQPTLPATLMIEEPETGIHPGRLRWIVEQFDEIAHRDDGLPPTQVLISTHSPYLLDQFHEQPEAVRVVECLDGASRVRALPEVLDELQVTHDDIEPDSLGRMWYARLLEEA